MKKNKIIYISLSSFLLLIIFSIILAMAIIQINKWKKDVKENENIKKDIQENAIIHEENNVEEEHKYKVDFNALKEINSEVVGWLEVPGTSVNYSIVKTNNNDYNLHFARKP